MNPVEEIKQKLDLAEIVGEYLTLKTAGGSSLKGLCPFHREKTPSFYVSRDKQLWTCFGCGKGGDLFTFVMEMESLDFAETLRYLGEKAEVEVTRFERVDTNLRTRLFNLVGLAARVYQTILLEKEEAGGARDYLVGRGVTENEQRKFLLGYAPDLWDTLINFLKKKGFREQEIIEAGLAVRRQDGSGIYDRFRHRIMFPILDPRGKAVGFSGRLLDETRAEGKYINTPQTLIYNKSQILYGLSLAKSVIKQTGWLMVVEGNMDVIASHRTGLESVVASSGTALTVEQLNLIRRFTDTILICFDADLAGESAAKRGIDAALAVGLNVRVIKLPVGFKDPDECVRKDPELWKKTVSEATEVMTYYFSQVFASGLPKTAEEKKRAGKLLLPEIARLSDSIERTHWLHELSGRLNTPEATLEEALQRFKKPEMGEEKPLAVETRVKDVDRSTALAEFFLSLFLGQASLRQLFLERVRAEWLPPVYQNLYRQMATVYHSKEDTSLTFFSIFREKIATSEPEALLIFDRLSLESELRLPELSPRDLEVEVEQIIRTLETNYRRQTREELVQELRVAEEQGDQVRVKELMKRFNELV